MIKKLGLLIMLIMIATSVNANDFTKCVEINQVLKDNIAGYEKRIAVDQEQCDTRIQKEKLKLLECEKDNMYIIRIPFTRIGIKASHVQGFIAGYILGVL